MQYEFLKSGLEALKIRIILESELYHISRIIDSFVFVEDVESFEVLAFFVTNDCFLCLVMIVRPTESHCLSVPTLAFD